MRSLRTRLTITHIVVALVAVFVVAGLASILIQRGFDNLADRQARSEAQDVAANLGEYYQRRSTWRGVEMFLRRRFPVLQANSTSERRRIQVLDENGSVIFDSFQFRAARSIAPIQNAVREPIIVGDQEVGCVLASSAREELTAAERDFLTRVRFSVLIGSLAAGAVALVAGLVSAAQVTSPLRSLTSAVRRLAAGERHEVLEVPKDRELAELATAFNQMASELERQEQLRRHQVADIAHELRTPISVLRLQLESLEDGIEQPTPALLGSLTEEVGLLSRLVDDLRLLSLADAGQLTLQPAALDTAEVLDSVALRAAARARQQGITLRVEPGTGIQVQADPQRLAQILGNLVENALRYTPRGGSVVLAVQQQGSGTENQLTTQYLASRQNQEPKTKNQRTTAQAEVSAISIIFTVKDTGPGIPPEDLARLFERFWRADRARTRETGGSGLGLAIVQRLTELQGGKVWATSQVGQGTTFHVALPGG